MSRRIFTTIYQKEQEQQPKFQQEKITSAELVGVLFSFFNYIIDTLHAVFIIIVLKLHKKHVRYAYLHSTFC